ncbi:MAG TPA: arginine--tRNA ligase [Streptosporangiaceae bacterium]|nr:arginine--tRNA ligase [Streptosporangiaceae bacterium]
MADPQQVLAERVRDAIVAAFGADYRDADPLIRPSSFADFQANVALPLGKRLGRPPREVAAALAAQLDVSDMCVAPEVSGPGFVNFTLRDEWIGSSATVLAADERLGVAPATPPRTVVVEYSSPNIAKEMHVGHLRTTIVGDALARIGDFTGEHVIRDNHVGDWGTPFGMLIEHLLDAGEDAVAGGPGQFSSAEADLLRTDPNTFYLHARRKFESDQVFAGRARARIVSLQRGDPETMRIWQEVCDLSKAYLRDTYARLGVTLTDDDIRGESFYNDMLADTAEQLVAKGLAVESDGALCVFPDGFTGRDGNPLPVIIRKSDGGWNYSTSDLATVRYRIDKLNCDQALYVVGSEQALHFQMVFAVARAAGWLPRSADFEHIQIGLVQGPDGGRLRTREGDNPKLSDLLSEAVQRARAILDEQGASSRFDEAELAAIAEAVGIGAVKYADLSTAHDSSYVFDLDRMVSFRGNTGPYLQYAAVRIQSIFRKSGHQNDLSASAPIDITAAAERALALRLLGFGAVVGAVAETHEPHRLCAYLFDVASVFTTFFEECPVLKAPSAELRDSRLALCALTLRVLSQGLDLLGVPVPDQM